MKLVYNSLAEFNEDYVKDPHGYIHYQELYVLTKYWRYVWHSGRRWFLHREVWRGTRLRTDNTAIFNQVSNLDKHIKTPLNNFYIRLLLDGKKTYREVLIKLPVNQYLANLGFFEIGELK